MTTPRILSTPEQDKLLDALSASPHSPHTWYTSRRNRLVGLLMLDAGLRASELIKLNVSDAYFDQAPRTHLEIPNSIAKYSVGGSIPISDRLNAALVAYAERAFDNRPPSPHHPLLFQHSTRRPLSRRTIHRIISDAGTQSLGRPVFPHMLRHTFIDRLRTVTDLPTVQLLARHKHLSSTQQYTHPTLAQTADAIRAMNRPPVQP